MYASLYKYLENFKEGKATSTALSGRRQHEFRLLAPFYDMYRDMPG
jgi:hypothetical protein